MNFFTTFVSQLFTGISTKTVPAVWPWTPWIFTARSLDRTSQGTPYVSTRGICSGWSCSIIPGSLSFACCVVEEENKKAVPKQLARAASKKVVSVPDRNTKPNHTHTYTHTWTRTWRAPGRGESIPAAPAWRNSELRMPTLHLARQRPSQAGRQTEAMPSPMVMLSVLYVNIYNS